MYNLLRWIAAGISRMSSPAIDRVAAILAWLVFDLLRLRRGLILRNLRLAFPEMPASERQRIGRLSVKHTMTTALELFRSAGTDIAGNIAWRGVEHIRGALAEGKGVYVLCFHMGSWEAMGAAVTRCIAPAHVLVKKVGSTSVDRFVSELRDRNGFLTVKRKKKGDGYAAIRDILARGEIVGFVMDQARPGEPKLPFFGHPAKTNTSLAAIWQRLPAPIVPAMITRTGVSAHLIEFLPALVLSTSGDGPTDIAQHSAAFNAVVEACVRRCPEQYFWMHNRWK